MPERKDARTPEKFFIQISKNHQPNTSYCNARVLPNSLKIIISNYIIWIRKTSELFRVGILSKFVSLGKKTAKNVPCHYAKVFLSLAGAFCAPTALLLFTWHHILIFASVFSGCFSRCLIRRAAVSAKRLPIPHSPYS